LSHRILIVTDAWSPQVNGVVRTLTTVVKELRAMGHAVKVISPDLFRTIPCPTYSDIPLALLPRRKLVRIIEAFQAGGDAHLDGGAAGIGGTKLGDAQRL
jgi:1,2-diacylglycerol 3-alpha-glucosyltransferase/glucuronosyltransferase